MSGSADSGIADEIPCWKNVAAEAVGGSLEGGRHEARPSGDGWEPDASCRVASGVASGVVPRGVANDGTSDDGTLCDTLTLNTCTNL